MGHVPSNKLKRNDILPFNDAKKKHFDKSEEFDREHWVYIPDFYCDYRYILGTQGKNPLITIGINPSTASPNNLDNTLKSVERKSFFCGFDSFIMFNVYAQRATDPKHLDENFNDYLHKQNMKAFEWVLNCCCASNNRPYIWAAWGTVIETRSYLKYCLQDMLKIGLKCNAKWLKAGPLLKAGHPHHPLYIRNDIKLDKFDVQNYLKKI